MNFWIINHTDKPEPDHVVQEMSDMYGSAEYLADRLRDWGTMTLCEQSTLIEDFGFDVTVAGDTAHFVKTRASIAKYRDGRIREWQSTITDFKLRIK